VRKNEKEGLRQSQRENRIPNRDRCIQTKRGGEKEGQTETDIIKTTIKYS